MLHQQCTMNINFIISLNSRISKKQPAAKQIFENAIDYEKADFSEIAKS